MAIIIGRLQCVKKHTMALKELEPDTEKKAIWQLKKQISDR